MTRDDDAIALLRRIGDGRVSDSAYDTGWTARLADTDPALAASALDWLRAHQLPDGTWGAKAPYHPHDRVLCTLSATIALTLHGSGTDHQLVRRAAPALRKALAAVSRTTTTETAGFGLLAATLLRHAWELGIVGDEAENILVLLAAEREQHLAAVRPGTVDSRSPLAGYAEFATGINLRLLAPDALVSPDGSVGSSPATTAFHVEVTGGSEQSLAYLWQMASQSGGMPATGPIDAFESAWSLRNFALTRTGIGRASAQRRRVLTGLEQSWMTGHGLGSGTGSSSVDSATTAAAYTVLSRSSTVVDLATLLAHTGTGHDTSTDVHLLEALRAAGLSRSHPYVGRMVQRLTASQHCTGFWRDPRHLSPFPVTAHAVIAGLGLDHHDGCFGRALRWLLDAQRSDGAWGFEDPTAEETACCLQAITLAHRRGESVPEQAVRDGHGWLQRETGRPHPALWIGKSLYAPGTLIDSTVLSALTLAEEDRLTSLDATSANAGR
ncbi:hypothetical protein ACIOD2_46955 [Amycolatopsis sp. NPDC088138]|uniref:hypothetical protein n=1 Tax=Amycolatopsis sp. NPDC088138 TaxID=3363938 RepID=UPI0037FCD2EC